MVSLEFIDIGYLLAKRSKVFTSRALLHPVGGQDKQASVHLPSITRAQNIFCRVLPLEILALNCLQNLYLVAQSIETIHNANMKVRKPTSKRVPVRLRHKIEKASAAKQRKNRKLAKKVR
jgi:hypothetical protein